MNRAERRRQERLMAKGRLSPQPPSARSLMSEAVGYHRKGQFKKAEELYRKILKYDPTIADAWHLLGLALHQQSDSVQARQLIERALQLDPNNALYRFNLGLVFEKLGLLDDAVASYREAGRLKPHFVEAQSNLGNVLRQQKKLDEAIAALKHAIAIKPDYAEGYNNLGVALKEAKDFNGAREAYQQALDLNPQNVQAHFNLGMVFLQQNHLDRAVRAFQYAIQLHPGYAKAHHNLGLALLGQGHRTLALPHFRKSAELLQNHGQPINIHHVFPSRIKHDAEQLDYLQTQGISLPIAASYSQTLRALYQQVQSQGNSNQAVRVNEEQRKALAPSFNQILHVADNPEMKDGALNPELDCEEIQNRYCAGQPEMIVIDSLLKEEALQSIRRFCLESTIWKKDYGEGYSGAFLCEGFSSPLLLQIAEELRCRFPRIFQHHHLLQAWAFKQDSRRLPLNIHADAAAVNVNFWITPNEANLDPTCGGLRVWDKEAPKDWDFSVYNNSKYKPKIMEFLQASGASPITVPYRENRALIFNSDLFHESDRCVFRDNYESRRINITLLYGHRA